MKVSDMQENIKYRCYWRGCFYNNWTKKAIEHKYPWMCDLDIWEVEDE